MRLFFQIIIYNDRLLIKAFLAKILRICSLPIIFQLFPKNFCSFIIYLEEQTNKPQQNNMMGRNKKKKAYT